MDPRNEAMPAAGGAVAAAALAAVDARGLCGGSAQGPARSLGPSGRGEPRKRGAKRGYTAKDRRFVYPKKRGERGKTHKRHPRGRILLPLERIFQFKQLEV